MTVHIYHRTNRRGVIEGSVFSPETRTRMVQTRKHCHNHCTILTSIRHNTSVKEKFSITTKSLLQLLTTRCRKSSLTVRPPQPSPVYRHDKNLSQDWVICLKRKFEVKVTCIKHPGCFHAENGAIEFASATFQPQLILRLVRPRASAGFHYHWIMPLFRCMLLWAKKLHVEKDLSTACRKRLSACFTKGSF